MAIIFSSNILEQLKLMAEKQQKKIRFSALIGSIDSENNEISIISAIHFASDQNKKEVSLILAAEEINLLKTLRYMLPYMLEVIGVAFYIEEEFSVATLKQFTESVSELKRLALVANVQVNNVNSYSVSKEDPRKLKIETQDLELENMLEFIHTLEIEIPESIAKDPSQLKNALIKELRKLWDTIVFNKDSSLTVASIISEKKPSDRIIELIVPCELREFGQKTEEGKVYIAFDLHTHLYPIKSLKDKRLEELTDVLSKAIIRDLSVKLQRAIFDHKIRALIASGKMPIELFGLCLSAFPSKDNLSRYEYDLCTRLIAHSKLMAMIGNDLKARILLRDLYEYFKSIDDKKKQKEIEELLIKIS